MHSALVSALFLLVAASSIKASPLDEIASLTPLWRDNAPRCEGYPSSASCHDGDMTLFSGLLCAAGDPLGCEAVKAAQESSGRWFRSPRLAANPELTIEEDGKSHNTFSWDMVLGVQLYVATTNDVASLNKWLNWVEQNRPCLVESPVIDGEKYCLVRGWPRWCTDDVDEKGCTAKPQQLATLVRTIDRVGAKIPDAAESALPGGLVGAVLKKLQEEAREANSALSLRKLLAASRELQPSVLMADATLNRPGYSRHLVGVEILLARRLGLGSDEVDLAAHIMAIKEKNNPFFLALHEGPTDRVASMLLSLSPRDNSSLPENMADWTWQREDVVSTAKEANLWDFVFLGNLLRQMKSSGEFSKK